jgi:hypothetical protein
MMVEIQAEGPVNMRLAVVEALAQWDTMEVAHIHLLIRGEVLGYRKG